MSARPPLIDLHRHLDGSIRLATILDQNGDGSIMDDLARMSGGAKSGGCLSALLGGLLGGGKRP